MIGRALQRKTIPGLSNLVDQSQVPWSLNPQGWLTGGSTRVSIDQAVGLPALLAVLLRIGHGVGMAPQKVYEGPALNREEAVGSWQYELLHTRPSSEVTPAVFRANLAVQVAGAGYAVVRKWKGSSGRVGELQVMDSAKVRPVRAKGQLVFEDSSGDMPVVRTKDEVIYVPSLSLDGGPVGVSPLAAYRVGISVGLKRQRFELAHYDNGAQPGTVLSFPADLDHAQALAWVDKWDEAHQGADRAFSTAAIGGGATVTTLPVSLADAQFAESTQMTSAQAGAVYAMPKCFLNIGDPPTDLDWRFLVTFCLGPYFTAIDQAFNADHDLFPAGSGMKAEHVTEALLKPDLRTRYEAYKAARQAGWLTSNEVRALENYPPHDDGDVLQVVPVGGGANPENDLPAAR